MATSTKLIVQVKRMIASLSPRMFTRVYDAHAERSPATLLADALRRATYKVIQHKKPQDESSNSTLCNINASKLSLLHVAVRHDGLVFQPLPPLLVHFAVRAPAQQQESGNDQEAAADGCHGERLTSRESPVCDGDEEDRESGMRLAG